MIGRTTAALVTALALVAALSLGTRVAQAQPAKALVPVPAATVSLMSARDMDPLAPILVRTYKKESELEVWKMTRAGRYALLKTFPICRWSGQLGPKLRTGDRQAPEGFYAISARQMNPNSAYHLSFDLGYPNAYDRAHGATGSYLMVHGICSSMGCYAMTDAQISEIYGLARDALAAGQRAFQVQAFPFRMSVANLARARSEKYIEFWRQMKEGSDRFESTGEEPVVGVSASGRYTFAPSRNAVREAAAQGRLAEEARKIAALVEDGAAAVRVTYSDGGMNASFAALARRGVDLGQVSRPEALAFAGKEIVLIPAHKKPLPTAVAVLAPPPAVIPVRLGPDAGGWTVLFARAPLMPDPGLAGLAMRGSRAMILAAAFVRSPTAQLTLGLN